jgi:hypothetical protein
MERNFEILVGFELRCDGQIFDLHNDFDFQTYAFDVGERSLVLTWSARDPARTNAPLTVRFEEVSFITVCPRDPNAPIEDDACVSLIGFLPPDIDMKGSHVDEGAITAKDHMVFEFESDWSLRVFADRARMSF